MIIQILPLILSAVLAIVILFLRQTLPARMPLFYSLPWGEGQLASGVQFLIIPAILACISLINLMTTWQLHQNQVLFKQILSFTSLGIAGILTLTIIKIMLIFI